MTRASAALIAAFLLAGAVPALAQEREVGLYRLPRRGPTGPDTSPSTYRDPVAQGIAAGHGQAQTMATTQVEKLSRWDRAAFTKRRRQVQHRRQTALVHHADQLQKNAYFKGLGRVNWLADSPATIAGHLSVGNYETASVATLDEVAKGYAAAKAALAAGKLGGAVGTFFGGPPGGMIGAAAGAVAGAVVATAGYNAFVSSTVTGSAEATIESLQTTPRIQAWRNRQEHLLAEAMRAQECECYLFAAPVGRAEYLRATPAARGEGFAQQPSPPVLEPGGVLLELPEHSDVRPTFVQGSPFEALHKGLGPVGLSETSSSDGRTTMNLIDWLRRLGILRFGVEGAVYRNATERPLSFQDDNVFNSEKDVIHFGRRPQHASPEGETPKGM